MTIWTEDGRLLPDSLAYEAVTFLAVNVGHNQTAARVEFFERTPFVSRYAEGVFKVLLEADIVRRAEMAKAYPETVMLFNAWTSGGLNPIFDWLKANPIPKELQRAKR
jgi:hypothetical protein